MTFNEPQLGQLVKSKAGRDKKKFFIICGVLNHNYVLIVDGDLRKVDNPKKKSTKHIQVMPKVAEEIRDKIKKGEKVCNAEIKEVIEVLGRGFE